MCNALQLRTSRYKNAGFIFTLMSVRLPSEKEIFLPLLQLSTSYSHMYYHQLVHNIGVQCTNRLPTCFGVTSHHLQGRHTEHLKMHKPNSLGIY
jgi:hypothetical protein